MIMIEKMALKNVSHSARILRATVDHLCATGRYDESGCDTCRIRDLCDVVAELEKVEDFLLSI